MKKLLLTLTATAFLLSFSTSAQACMGEGHKRGGKKFEKMDKNSDGFVTKDELIAHVNEMFKKKDANGDGKISKEEMKNFHKGKMKMMKGMSDRMKGKHGDIKDSHGDGHH